jgi:hypothetical protein
LLKKFGMLHWVIAFVKDEGTNLVTMVITLHFIVDCEPLNSFRVYEGTSFGRVMFKAYQYVTNDDKVFARLQHVSAKDAQVGYRKPLIKPNGQGRGGRNGNGRVLKVKCDTKN